MLRSALFEISGGVFYVTKKGKNENKIFLRYLGKCDIIIIKWGLNSSKPCSRCLERLKKLGLRRVYYSYDGTPNLKMEKINTIESDHLSSKYQRAWSTFK